MPKNGDLVNCSLILLDYIFFFLVKLWSTSFPKW